MVSPYISIIQVPPELTVDIYFFSVVLAVTIGSSLAVYFVEGESRFTLLMYLGLLMIISAASFLAVSLSVESLFRAMFNIEGLGGLVKVG
jgi:archaellum biogenesis protein FlaJ (TadC family)